MPLSSAGAADLVHATPLDSRYPSRLRSLAKAPASITFRGGAMEAERVVAIVGSRKFDSAARDYARALAGELASLGVVIASGGAAGIDRAAHEGALDAGGRTWVVAPTGHLRCYPAHHAALFDRIGDGPGAVLWPFPPAAQSRSAFDERNRFLVTMSDAVVIAQAGRPSGALNTARWARKLKRPLWVVPMPPWIENAAGSHQLLLEGVRPLTSIHELLASLPPNDLRRLNLGLADGSAACAATAPAPDEAGLLALVPRALSSMEIRVLRALSEVPLHLDGVAVKARLGAQATGVALLTLALEDVVVEGPPSFFRRQRPR